MDGVISQQSTDEEPKKVSGTNGTVVPRTARSFPWNNAMIFDKNHVAEERLD
jgi:hypothetical protein